MSGPHAISMSTVAAVVDNVDFRVDNVGQAASCEAHLNQIEIDAFDLDGKSVFGERHVTMADVVRALNHHDELVSALKQAERALIASGTLGAGSAWNDLRSETIEAARAALRKVGAL